MNYLSGVKIGSFDENALINNKTLLKLLRKKEFFSGVIAIVFQCENESQEVRIYFCGFSC